MSSNVVDPELYKRFLEFYSEEQEKTKRQTEKEVIDRVKKDPAQLLPDYGPIVTQSFKMRKYHHERLKDMAYTLQQYGDEYKNITLSKILGRAIDKFEQFLTEEMQISIRNRPQSVRSFETEHAMRVISGKNKAKGSSAPNEQ